MSGAQAKADSFVELLRPLQGPLEVYCRRMLRNRSLVEDVIQSAVAAAYASFGHFMPGTNFKAWIFRFVTLEIFNCNRKLEPVSVAEVPWTCPQRNRGNSWRWATCSMRCSKTRMSCCSISTTW